MKNLVKKVLSFMAQRKAQKTRKKEVKAMFEMLNNL
jgi:hypothetical protein